METEYFNTTTPLCAGLSLQREAKKIKINSNNKIKAKHFLHCDDS